MADAHHLQYEENGREDGSDYEGEKVSDIGEEEEEEEEEEEFDAEEEYFDDFEDDDFEGTEEMEGYEEDEFDGPAVADDYIPLNRRRYLKKEDDDEEEDEEDDFKTVEETKAELNELLRGQDPELLEQWINDPDGLNARAPIPDDAVPIRNNNIPILAICAGKHVLIIQPSRMQAIGSRLHDLLSCESVKKLAYGHIQHCLRLKTIGVTVRAGEEIGQQLVRAMERKSLNEVPYELRQLQPHNYARLLAGVDISDREYYNREFDNPLLTERQVSGTAPLLAFAQDRKLVCAQC